MRSPFSFDAERIVLSRGPGWLRGQRAARSCWQTIPGFLQHQGPAEHSLISVATLLVALALQLPGLGEALSWTVGFAMPVLGIAITLEGLLIFYLLADIYLGRFRELAAHEVERVADILETPGNQVWAEAVATWLQARPLMGADLRCLERAERQKVRRKARKQTS